jgi:hypothetical protein
LFFKNISMGGTGQQRSAVMAQPVISGHYVANQSYIRRATGPVAQRRRQGSQNLEKIKGAVNIHGAQAQAQATMGF